MGSTKKTTKQENKPAGKKTTEKESNEKRDENWQFNFLLGQFKKESDRAAVILIASMLDEILGTLLKSFFVATPASEDSLFDNATSPLSTFSSKIDMAYRAGLISSKFSRDLHIVRKIRNSFAHDIYGCSFENGSVKSRIMELENSVLHSKKIDSVGRTDDLLDGVRGMFLYITAAMLWQLNKLTKQTKELKEAELEWFYEEIND